MSNPMAASTLHHPIATRPSVRHCGTARRRAMATRSARQVASAAAARPGQEGWAAAGPSGLLRLACAAAGSGLLLAGPAHADKVAEFATSGFLFKDTAEVVAIDDKEAPGVLLYLTDVNRSITEKLSKDFFGDPSQASLTCVAAGPVTLRDPAAVRGKEGKEIFEKSKGLNIFQQKTLRVRRIYDEQNGNLIYVAYNTRLSSTKDEGGESPSRYRTSLCALPVAPLVAAAAPGAGN